MEQKPQQDLDDIAISEDTQSPVVPSPNDQVLSCVSVTPPDQTDCEANNANEKPRGRPFRPGESGNPAGRPRGARNRTTLAAEQLLDGEAEVLTRKAIELAKEDNLSALRLCIDRILPPPAATACS